MEVVGAASAAKELDERSEATPVPEATAIPAAEPCAPVAPGGFEGATKGPEAAPAPESPPSAAMPDWLGRNIYVSNLPPIHPFSTIMPSEQHVTNLFSQFGEIERIRVVRDRHTNLPVGIAMVLFKEPEAAQQAIVSVNAANIGAIASMWVPKSVLLGTS